MRHENKALIEIKGKKRDGEKQSKKKEKDDMRRRKTMEKTSKEGRGGKEGYEIQLSVV